MSQAHFDLNRKNMRIGIDARFYGSLGKGLGRYTEKLIQELEKLPSQDTFFVFLRRENFADYTPHNDRFVKVLADFSWYGWREQFLFPRLLSRYQLDLVHFPHFNVPLLYLRPFVVTIHDLILFHYPTVKASELPPLLYWMKYWLYRLVILMAVYRAKRVITVSKFTAQDITQAYPIARKKITTTYEAAETFCFWMRREDSIKYLASYGLTPRGGDHPYILYVGNAYPHKNLEFLLEVAAMLPEKTFVCVGRDDFFYTQIKEQAKTRRLKNVCFVGFVSDQYLSVLYREAESYFFPSLYEGFGLPGLEALLHGTPVVAARTSALPEILDGAALFFDPTNAKTVRALLRQLGEDDQLRSQLIKQGYQRVKQFSWRTMAQATLQEYYESVAYERYPPSSKSSAEDSRR